MKRNSLLTLGVCLASVLGLAISTQPASAQMIETVKVTLAHATSVGSVTLPAGDYTIRDIRDDGSSQVLQIRSLDGELSVSAMVMPVSQANHGTAERTQVVFRMTGGKYQLEKVWIAGREYGYELLSAH